MSPPEDIDYQAQVANLAAGALDLLRRGVAPQPAEATAVKTDPTTFGPLHTAASVLSSFDRSKLNPAPAPLADSAGEDMLDVLADSTPVRDRDGQPRWKLLEDVRRDLLQRLGSREAIEQALDANPDRPRDDPVQAMFEAFVRGNAPPLEQHDITQLAATFEVAQWFDGLKVELGSPLPDAKTIRTRTDYLTLLHPFEQLAGEKFAGRTSELKALRDYVGVVPPSRTGGTFYRTVRRAAEEVFSLTEKPVLFISGPGGIGKSALISRFIWEHTTLTDEQQFPFVYLDLDRVRLQADEPLTLLVEAVRQIGLQYEEARRYAERVQAGWQAELLGRYAAARTGTTKPLLELESHVADFASLLRNVRDGRDPCLFVLDTFEEAQYRGDVVVASLCEFLQRLQAAVPRLRIVAAGRAELAVNGFPTKALQLGDFDRDAATAFLEARGLADPATVRTIIKRVGRNPLSLLLAATVVDSARQRGETESFDSLGNTEAQIQGQLYRRILMHIKDDEVASLAYPGLVLRRVTPEIIRYVLADPCDVRVPDDAAAADLFNRLALEVSLVHEEDGALVHRRDVRRIMLPLLRDAGAGSVSRIEDAAIAYYEHRADPIDRAEEIYHRLARHQQLDVIASRWTDDVKPYLFGALDENELGARERAWLLQRLDPKRQLSEEERAAADLETWEWDTLSTTRELVQRDRPEAALDLLRSRPERSPGSPLYSVEADALERSQRWRAALSVLRAGIDSARDKGDTGLLIDLMTRAASVSIRQNDVHSAEAFLDQAEQLLSDRQDDRLRALHISLSRLELARRQNPTAADAVAALAQSRLDQVSDRQLRANQELAAWAAAELGRAHPPIFQRVVAVVGLGRGQRRLRALATSIAQWDDEASRAANRWKGILGGDELPWAETLTEAWTQLLRDLRPRELGARLSALLGRFDPPPRLLEDLEAMMVEQSGSLILRESAAESAPHAIEEPAAEPSPETRETGTGPYAGAAGIRLGRKQSAALALALCEAFPSRAELTTFVKVRLGRSVDSISFSTDLATTGRELVEAASREGWSVALLAAGLDSRPGHVGLRAIAEEIGLVPVGPVDALRDAVGRGAFIDLDRWRSALGMREAQVCSIGGSNEVYGTGFLVGPDLVLTAEHVVHRLITGELAYGQVLVAFDFRTLPNGQVVHHGTLYSLRSDWLVSFSPLSGGGVGLGYALLRVEGTPGSDPVGGDAAEPGAMRRGWMVPPRRTYDALAGSPVVILHQDSNGALQITVDMEGLVGSQVAIMRVQYAPKVVLGAAGAPCFDLDWELVALHQSRLPSGFNEGVPMSAIVRDLEARGSAEELYRAPV